MSIPKTCCRALSLGLILSFLFTFEAIAQEANDTSKVKKGYVLVIPFSPTMYKTVGEHFICKSSDITPAQLNDVFRRSIEATLIEGLAEHYNSKAIENNSMADRRSDLQTIYNITHYENTKKKLKAYHKGYPPFKLKHILGGSYKKYGTDCINSDMEKPGKSKHNYQKAKIVRDSVFTDIVKKNDGAYVLYISNFEMNTRFKTCLDPRENVFQRDLYIHYNLMDASGEVIDGGVVGTTYQSNTNDITTLLDKNLGILCGMIVDLLRQKI